MSEGPEPGAPPQTLSITTGAALLALVFLSGACALLYQVYWMRTLSLTFGNAAQASAATLAAFFFGLGLGSRILGRAVSATRNPLRTFAALEIGVVAGAAWFLVVDLASRHVAPTVDDPSSAGLATTVRFGLAMIAMLPATFFMGGTLPALGEAITSSVAHLGRRVTLVYGLNTLGGALGAGLGAFVLPPIIGYRMTLATTLTASAFVAVAAWALSRRTALPREHTRDTRPRWKPGRALAAAAVLSGAATLALEVLWTRMFAQVFHNSVYSFGAVLVTFLVALGLGAQVARVLARSHLPTSGVLTALWIASGLLTGSSPFVFDSITEGMSYVGRSLDFADYITELFITTTVVLLLPVTVMGAIFPYLLRIAERDARRVGETVGDLAALNIAGAVVGATGAGFVLLGSLGLWSSIGLIACLYVLAAFVLVAPDAARGQSDIARFAAAAAMVVLITVANPARLAVIKVDRPGRGELLVQHWEGPHGVVAVVQRDGALALKINNFYTLGSEAGAQYERRQAHLPLAIHGAARSVFFLGVGTGITAGAALDHPIDSLVAAELTAEVVTAARTHFAPHASGLFADPRARVLVEDGRAFLRQSEQHFDVIISDLFVPWRAGVGALYTREHFSAARERLEPGGIFCQWLPMFQLDEKGFKTIAQTFLEVFPDATLWRGDFFGKGSIVALVGHTTPLRYDPDQLARSHQTFVASRGNVTPADAVGTDPADFLLYYAGNLGRARALLEDAVVDTDDRSLMGFHAPVAQRRVAAGSGRWFDGPLLMQFMEATLSLTSPAQDPVLSSLTEDARARVRAGFALHQAQTFRQAGDEERAARLLATFQELLAQGKPSNADTAAARAELRRELESLRSQLERRLNSIEERLPPLERPR